jgi:hypothetical protein
MHCPRCHYDTIEESTVVVDTYAKRIQKAINDALSSNLLVTPGTEVRFDHQRIDPETWRGVLTHTTAGSIQFEVVEDRYSITLVPGVQSALATANTLAAPKSAYAYETLVWFDDHSVPPIETLVVDALYMLHGLTRKLENRQRDEKGKFLS